jgi:uncharacterized membrane protein YgcG
MNCPRCHSDVQPTAEHCQFCGFESNGLCSKLGDHWVRLDRLTDPANCLRLGERRTLESSLDEFERRFPQVFFAVYFGVLPPGFSSSEVAFWLLNHAAFGTQEITKRNEYGIVLVVDPSASTASFGLGYAIETVEAKLGVRKTLSQMSPYLIRGDYGRAVQTAIRQLDRSLRKIGQSSPRDPRVSSTHALATDLGLTPLRTPARSALIDQEPTNYRLDG